MITAHEVQTAQFRRAGAGKVGYDEIGVDDYLDRVVATLEAIERGDDMPSDALSANDVVDVVFAERGPQANGGYDLDDVDDLLDRVAQRIHTYEAGVRRAAAPVEGGLPRDARASGSESTRDDRDFADADRRRDADVIGGRDERNERRPAGYAEPVAPEFADSSRGDAYDDGGVRDGAALAEAGGAPSRDTDDFDNRGFARAGDDRGAAGLGAAAAGGAVAAGAVAHGHRDDERTGQGFTSADEGRGFGEPGVRADDRGTVARGDNDGSASPTSSSGSNTAGGINMVGSDPVDEAPIVAPGEGHRGVRSDAGRDEYARHDVERGGDAPDRGRGFLPSGERGAEERFDAERRDDGVTDGTARGEAQGRYDFDADRRSDEQDGTRHDAYSSAAGAGTGAVVGADAPRHSGQRVERDSAAQQGAYEQVSPVADPQRAQHDAADFHDSAAAHSATFAEPTPNRVVPAEQSHRRDEASTFEGDRLRGDEQTDGRDTNGGEVTAGGGVTEADSVEARPIATQPQIVSHRATDHRVPLPRNDVRGSVSDEDREAEAQYHPEFSSYSTPEQGTDEGVRARGDLDTERGADAGRASGQEATAPRHATTSGDADRYGAPSADRQADPYAADARRDGSFDVAGGGDDVRGGDSSFGWQTPDQAERPDSQAAGAPQRVAPMNEETARVREPRREGGLEQRASARDPFADDARRDGSFDVAGGGDDVRRTDSSITDTNSGTTTDAPGTSFERTDASAGANAQAPQEQFDHGTQAQSVGRPESIDRPEPIDKAQGLPAREDTSRKGLLRRIFKG